MWHESDFERWFLHNPVLPGGERLLLVARQRALRRVVDLLFLDPAGGLVLIEVKNETSSRTVIGQALEYLSQYEGTQLDAILDDLSTEEGPAAEQAIAISNVGITEITGTRRVYLAAPAFDLATQAAVAFLNDRFAAADLHLGLISIATAGEGFNIAFLDPARPRPIRDLRGRCGLNRFGRLFFILPHSINNLVVNLGRVRDGRLNRPKGQTATQRLVRRRAGSLIPYEGPFLPDLTGFGTVWRHRRRPRHAIVLARVQDRPTEAEHLVYFALEEAGELRGYWVRTASTFDEWYLPTTDSGLDWDRLLMSAV